MLSKNFDSHGSCNRDSAHTEKTRIFFFFFLSQCIFPKQRYYQTDLETLCQHQKSSTEPWCPVHFHLSSSTCLFKQVFPCHGVLSSYPVSIYPSHWSLPTGRPLFRIFAYWPNVLTQHSSQTPSCPSPPSLLFSDITSKIHIKNSLSN